MWHTDVLNIGFERRLKNFENQGNLFKGIEQNRFLNSIQTKVYQTMFMF